VAPADLPGEPDEAAVLAVGDRGQLAAAAVSKLTAIASDSADSIISRQHAVISLRVLLSHLPTNLCASLARDLATLHQNPGLSEQDMWDLQFLRPLSSGHIDTGARTFGAEVLLAAAEACAQAGAGGEADELLAAEIVNADVDLICNDDADVAAPGARALAVASPFAPDAAVSPLLLAGHPEEPVRRQAVALWLATGGPPGIIGRLAKDESPEVRANVAHDAERAAATAPAEAGAIRALADDPDYARTPRLSPPARPNVRPLRGH
jgi:hypothetical protein